MKEVVPAIQHSAIQNRAVIHHKPLRAPAHSGEALFDPPFDDAPEWLRRNLVLRRSWNCTLQGRSLHELQLAARHQLLRQARDYTARYRDLPPSDLDDEAPLVLTGHQPELVHAGVWFKSFVLSHLATTASAHAVNLLVDNDAVRSTNLRVPTGSADSPHIVTIPFDRPDREVPYEERQILDMDCFRSCGGRVLETIGALVPNSMIARFWPLAVDAAQEHSQLGRAIAQARHVLEGHWGLTSLELPLSSVCRGRPFRWFTAHLLANADKLRTVHNDCLREYRQVNRLRSHSHPVPDLTARDDWTEVPFWIWHRDDPSRRPAFVRRVGDAVELSDLGQIRASLTLAADHDATDAVDQLGQLEETGIRIRSRALITTMFARLLLSDLFIHGIGGAKYDQLTDAIVRRFFAIEPSAFLVVSATFRLPVSHTSVEPGDLASIDRMLRELRYHPELHVAATAETTRWIDEKRQSIQDNPPLGHRRERHHRIERANKALQPFLQPRYRQLLEQRKSLRTALGAATVLDSREYPFCLFPEDTLNPRLSELVSSSPRSLVAPQQEPNRQSTDHFKPTH